MTDHLHITTDSNDLITGTKTFNTAPVASGTAPSIMFLDTLLDPTMLTLRKVSGDIEIFDELGSATLIKLLSTVDASNIASSNITGSNITYSLADHKHQGIHSLMVSTPIFGDITIKLAGASILTQVAQDILVSLGYGVGSALPVATSSSPGSSTYVSREDHIHQGVRSIKVIGQSDIVGDVTLSEGTDITLTQVGNTITIDSTGVPGSLLALGILPVANGGTGLGNYTIGDLIVATAPTTLSRLADIATGNMLLSGGVGVVPFFGKANLSNHTIGVLPLAALPPGITGQVLLGNTTWGMYNITSNVLGVLNLARLQDDAVADKVLLSGGTGGDPHWGTIDTSTLSGTVTLAQIPDGSTAGQCLIGSGPTLDPAWGPLGLGTGTTGLLPISKGGTNTNNASVANGVLAGSTGASIQGLAWAAGNGATIIGETGSIAKRTTITAGTNISITNGANSIVVSSTGGSGDPTYSNTACYLRCSSENNLYLVQETAVGQYLDIDGIPRPISIHGLTTAGLSPETTYFIYAYWDGVVIQLEASTTGASLINGVVNKTGDSTRRLVGMARTTATTTWIDTNIAPSRGYVISYFNRRRKVVYANSTIDTTSPWATISTTSPFGGTKWYRLTVPISDPGSIHYWYPRFLSWGNYLDSSSFYSRLPDPVTYNIWMSGVINFTGTSPNSTVIFGVEQGYADGSNQFVQVAALPAGVLPNTKEVKVVNIWNGATYMKLRPVHVRAIAGQNDLGAYFNDPTKLHTAIGVIQTLGDTSGLNMEYRMAIEYYG